MNCRKTGWIDVWVLCDNAKISFPGPYLNNYSTSGLKEGSVDFKRSVVRRYLEGKLFRTTTIGKRAFSVHMKDVELNSIFIPKLKLVKHQFVQHAFAHSIFQMDGEYRLSFGNRHYAWESALPKQRRKLRKKSSYLSS